MVRWPELKHVIAVRAALTAIAYGAYVFYLHGLPPDELVMASTLSFQAIVGLIVLGLPSALFLLLFLLVRAIAKHWLFEPSSHGAKQKDAL